MPTQPRLALEVGERLWVIGDFVREEFQGHEGMQFQVLGFVDHPIPPPPSFSTIR
jgi:hypothetical protein